MLGCIDAPAAPATRGTVSLERAAEARGRRAPPPLTPRGGRRLPCRPRPWPALRVSGRRIASRPDARPRTAFSAAATPRGLGNSSSCRSGASGPGRLPPPSVARRCDDAIAPMPVGAEGGSPETLTRRGGRETGARPGGGREAGVFFIGKAPGVRAPGLESHQQARQDQGAEADEPRIQSGTCTRAGRADAEQKRRGCMATRLGCRPGRAGASSASGTCAHEARAVQGPASDDGMARSCRCEAAAAATCRLGGWLAWCCTWPRPRRDGQDEQARRGETGRRTGAAKETRTGGQPPPRPMASPPAQSGQPARQSRPPKQPAAGASDAAARAGRLGRGCLWTCLSGGRGFGGLKMERKSRRNFLVKKGGFFFLKNEQ